MSFPAQAVDPLFFRHDLMLELGRLDMYIASIDEQSALERQAHNDDVGSEFVAIEDGAVERRARIHEALSDMPV